MAALNEDAYELQCIEWLKATGWDYLHGGVIAPEGTAPERTTFKDVILGDRVEESLSRYRIKQFIECLES